MFLGLDLGTTNVKALVVDPAGRVVAEGSAPVGRTCTPDGGVEQDIATIWDAACAAVRAAAGAVEASQVRALGISSQGAALQLLDSDGSPRGPVISWLDGRGRPFDEQLTAELGAEFFLRHLGRTPCTMTPGQVLRLRHQHPERLPPTARLGWVGDVIVGRFCGRRAHDATSLSIAMLYNPWRNAADAEVLARIGFREDQLPELLPATTPAGRLTPAAAQQTGLPAGIPVSPAIHDQYAGVLGAGSVRAGDVYLGTGTAWVLLANTAALAEPVARGTFVCRHPVDGLGGQMLSMTNGGSALDWVLSLTGRPGRDQCELPLGQESTRNCSKPPGNSVGLAHAQRQAVDEALASVAPGSAGLCFWPLLAASAEVGPGRSVGGRLDGLTLGHAPQHLIRAAVEGLACELVRYLRLLTDAGLPVHRLILCGGAAASEVTPQIIADLAERPVACVTEPSVSALGAAVIARTLVEPDAALATLAEQLAPHCRTVAPSPAATVYRRLLERYLEPFGLDCPR